MLRYFFALHWPDKVHDDIDGTVLPNHDAAHAYAHRVIRELKEGGGYDDPGLTMVVRDPMSKPESTLTPRELEVLVLIARGQTSQRIGETLGIAKRTADEYVTSIIDKLGASNRTHAVTLAIGKHILTLD